jgi:hypothetical protein
MPAAEVRLGCASGVHVVMHHQVRERDPFVSGQQQPDGQLAILASGIRPEAAHGDEHVTAARHVAAGKAHPMVTVDAARFLTPLDDRHRALQRWTHPRRRTSRPPRPHPAGDEVDVRPGREFPGDDADPVRVGLLVVVGEGDDRCPRRERASVPRIAHPGA